LERQVAANARADGVIVQAAPRRGAEVSRHGTINQHRLAWTFNSIERATGRQLTELPM